MRAFPDTALAGRTALITGSERGLGLCFAGHFAAAGANVVMNGLAPAEAGGALAGTLRDAHGVDVAYEAADVSRREEVERLVEAASARFGGVDILVNNAVTRHFAPLEDFDPDAWERSFAVNVHAAFHAARLVLPFMKDNGWGRILNISSVYGNRGAEDRLDYVTTKTALIGMARGIAIETAKTGITCNAIVPGSVGTEAILDRIRRTAEETGEDFEALAQRYAAERSPTGRFVEMDSIAAMAIFLCGPAGADITGATLPVDGGWLAS